LSCPINEEYTDPNVKGIEGLIGHYRAEMLCWRSLWGVHALIEIQRRVFWKSVPEPAANETEPTVRAYTYGAEPAFLAPQSLYLQRREPELT
jgi:hypothetical protein